MKVDLSHYKECHDNWKRQVEATSIKGISKRNSDLIIQYTNDMELGQNTAKKSKKGARSYGRLVITRNLLIQISKFFEKEGAKDLSKITENQAHQLFNKLYTGQIKRQDGKPYTYAVQFVSIFKAFWHWWMKVNRKKGKMLIDICEDLELRNPEPKFVYITKEQLDKMLPHFNQEEQLLCLFLFDSIIRFPTECMSLKVKDVYKRGEITWLNIPSEISKTFGRNFNLLYCGDEILKYIERKKLENDDYLFSLDGNEVEAFNKKLKIVAIKVLGNKVSHPKAQGLYGEISGYDFRHSGAIHLRILAQKNNLISLDAIRQRGGWSDFGMLNYYTQLIGLTGEINKESLLIEEDKSKMEKEIIELKKRLERNESALEQLGVGRGVVDLQPIED